MLYRSFGNNYSGISLIELGKGGRNKIPVISGEGQKGETLAESNPLTTEVWEMRSRGLLRILIIKISESF